VVTLGVTRSAAVIGLFIEISLRKKANEIRTADGAGAKVPVPSPA
jgi:hypothetical protein